MLQPVSLIGLMLGASEISLAFVYCSPFALFILIILLNRHMKIISKSNMVFVITEISMMSLTILFIFVGEPFKIYVLLVIIILSAIAITTEIILVYYNGFVVKAALISPEMEQNEYA